MLQTCIILNVARMQYAAWKCSNEFEGRPQPFQHATIGIGGDCAHIDGPRKSLLSRGCPNGVRPYFSPVLTTCFFLFLHSALHHVLPSYPCPQASCFAMNYLCHVLLTVCSVTRSPLRLLIVCSPTFPWRTSLTGERAICQSSLFRHA